MKFLLLVTKPYSIAILQPVYDYLISSKRGKAKWFFTDRIAEGFTEFDGITSNQEVMEFNPDAVLVPGNVVPDFWPGLKVQIFHGLGEEKRGHYRITGFFDLYCTPGPFMTQIFSMLAEKKHTFLVKETGWPKLDPVKDYKRQGTQNFFQNTNPVILYAPTFSPRYSSAAKMVPHIQSLKEKPLNWIIKFHDLMEKKVVQEAKTLLSENITIPDDDNILPYMTESDMLIADTSSVTYEYLLFDKPIITCNGTTRLDKGINITSPEDLFGAIVRSIEDPTEFSENRKMYLNQLHPYLDGKSSERLIDTIISVLEHNEINRLKKKKPNFLLKRKARKLFSE